MQATLLLFTNIVCFFHIKCKCFRKGNRKEGKRNNFWEACYFVRFQCLICSSLLLVA